MALVTDDGKTIKTNKIKSFLIGDIFKNEWFTYLICMFSETPF